MGGNKEDGATAFSVVPTKRTKTYGYKTKQKKFPSKQGICLDMVLGNLLQLPHALSREVGDYDKRSFRYQGLFSLKL